VGQRPENLQQSLDFTEGLFRLAVEDGAVHKLMFEVLNLLKPRSALSDPDLVERVKTVAAPTTVGLGGERSFGDV
jgi:hypothetical protein